MDIKRIHIFIWFCFCFFFRTV